MHFAANLSRRLTTSVSAIPNGKKKRYFGILSLRTGYAMLRGEVRLIDFEPAVGQEPNKTRPAVIVSNDTANQLAAIHRGVITVVPLTSNVARVYPFQTFIDGSAAGLRMDSKSQPELTRSVSVSRVGKRVGKLTLQQLLDLDRALRIHLDL